MFALWQAMQHVVRRCDLCCAEHVNIMLGCIVFTQGGGIMGTECTLLAGQNCCGLRVVSQWMLLGSSLMEIQEHRLNIV